MIEKEFGPKTVLGAWVERKRFEKRVVSCEKITKIEQKVDKDTFGINNGVLDSLQFDLRVLDSIL